MGTQTRHMSFLSCRCGKILSAVAGCNIEMLAASPAQQSVPLNDIRREAVHDCGRPRATALEVGWGRIFLSEPNAVDVSIASLVRHCIFPLWTTNLKQLHAAFFACVWKWQNHLKGKFPVILKFVSNYWDLPRSTASGFSLHISSFLLVILALSYICRGWTIAVIHVLALPDFTAHAATMLSNNVHRKMHTYSFQIFVIYFSNSCHFLVILDEYVN